MTSSNELNDAQKVTLTAELQQAGIKHNPSKIVRIAKTTDEKIVFLEEGNDRNGLKHIVDTHASQFAAKGISIEQIPDAIIAAITQGYIVGIQGKTSSTPRTIYRVLFNGETKYIAVQIGDNGYIVSANPRKAPKI